MGFRIWSLYGSGFKVYGVWGFGAVAHSVFSLPQTRVWPGVAVHGMIAVMNPELQANQFEGGKAYLDPTKPTIFGFPVFRVSVAVKAC